MEITRALLEQYLRAVGDDGRAESVSKYGAKFSAVRIVRDFYPAPLAPEITFRLGLCAAAERTRRFANGQAESPFGEGAVAAGTHLYREFLHTAGIEPEAWEKARAKGGV